jgi:hypothetical protein
MEQQPNEYHEELNSLMARRREELGALRALGIDPYRAMRRLMRSCRHSSTMLRSAS